jgi:DNA-binding winged helix-turn-helix (wHTH) protein/TolB-like protein
MEEIKPDLLYEFGPFRLDPKERTLWRNGQIVPLYPKAFDLLLVLVEKHGHVVDKDTLLRTVWPDTFVEESNLTVHVSALRKILGVDANGRRYIETVPKRGYRFVHEVKLIEPGESNEAAVLSPRRVDRSSPSAFTRPKDWRLFLLICALLSGALLIALYTRSARPLDPRADQPIRSIAILPFKIIGNDENDQYLSLGLADMLITRLGAIDQIAVRPTSAVSGYAAKEFDGIKIGRELGVDAILEGTLQRDGDRLRATIRFVRVADGRTLWTDSYDEPFTDLFSVEDRISAHVLEFLRMNLGNRTAARLTRHATEKIEALQAYAKGRYFWSRRTTEGIKRGIEYFQQAVTVDPNFALAYVGLADCYNLLSLYGMAPPAESFAQAKAAITKALEIDDQLAEAHASLGYIKFRFDWDWAGAEQEFQRAIALKPGYAAAHHWYGEYLAAMGRFDEALSELKLAQELDPTSLAIGTDIGEIFYYWRRYDQTIEACRKVLEIDPKFIRARFELGRAYEHKGMLPEAAEEFMTAMAINSGTDSSLSANRHQALKWEALWRKRIDEEERATRSSSTGYTSGYTLAVEHLRLGEKEKALEWLEKAYRAHDPSVPFLGTDPAFDALHFDPRFDKLLRALGLNNAARGNMNDSDNAQRVSHLHHPE